MEKDSRENSTAHSDAISEGVDDNPKFGKLLIVLFLAVMAVAAITFLSEAYYS